MALPVVRLTGPPYEQGVQHGRALRDRIRHNLAVYFHRFEHEGRLPRDEVLLRVERYLEAIRAENPEYLEGMRGIAEGGGFDRLAIGALNVRYEILYHQYTARALAELELVDGCTSFAVEPSASASGHLLLGQNWDWIPEVRGAIIRTRDEDGLETAAFTEAGIFGGKIGLNSVGVGLAVNGMLSSGDDWSGLRRPFHVRCYEILRAREFDRAVEVVTGTPRSCSTNFLIGQAPDRIVDVEAAPSIERLLSPEDGLLVHANHFFDAGALGIEEPFTPRRAYSLKRQARLAELLGSSGALTLERVEAALRDHQEHPNSICRHPDPALPPAERSITVASTVMDLQARTLRISDGQPCSNGYQEVELGI